MDSATELSIEFLRSHPKGAAQVLETIALEDAVAFLKDVPDDAVGAAFEAMQPVVAAAILPSFTRKKAAKVLLVTDFHYRSGILRLLDDGLMASIMKQMPKSAARDLAKFLRYPEGSAGAWMSSDMAVFETSTEVGDCLAQLRGLPHKVRDPVFVVDESKTLHGTVELSGLLASPDDATIESVSDRHVKRLSPFARLSSLVALPAWDTALSLPVVDAKGRLLGALHFDLLREGLASERPRGPQAHMGRIMFHLAEAFLVCVAGLLHAPAVKPELSRPLGETEA